MEIYIFSGNPFRDDYTGHDSLQHDRYVFVGRLGDYNQVAADLLSVVIGGVLLTRQLQKFSIYENFYIHEKMNKIMNC